MTDKVPQINERSAAQRTLIAATRRVGDAMSPFSTWLLAGSGAALSLVVANIEAVSKYIAITHNLSRFAEEYERGLLPPIRWIARSSMKKAIQGDEIAGARMIAKLSQIHGLLVAGQSVLALIAIGALALGMKME